MCVTSCGSTESNTRWAEPWIVIRQPKTSPWSKTKVVAPPAPRFGADLHGHHAGLGPIGHRVPQPLDRQVVAELLGRRVDLGRHLRIGRLHNEIGALMTPPCSSRARLP